MPVTNDRYKNFTQSCYTVGDPEQFWATTHATNDVTPPQGGGSVSRPVSGHAITEADVENTFKYIFHKFKKGIFVRIRNNRLECFIPFSKALFVNEWSDRIAVDPKYGGRNDFERMHNFFKAHHTLTNTINKKNYRFRVEAVNLDPAYWFANNALLRYENPINEKDTNCLHLRSMFTTLCAERVVPDVSFFVNRRDYPILTKNGTEAYDHIYGDDEPLRSYKFEKYAPILSMCTGDRYADLPIPTYEDWARVTSQEDSGASELRAQAHVSEDSVNRVWSTKKQKAVFRGSNTGHGCSVADNTRLKLVALGRDHSRILDVGITKWNLRIRKAKDSPYLTIPDVSGFSLVPKLSYEQQSNYKYIVNVDGHVSAFRLSRLLGLSSCILIVESDYALWFSRMLRPYEHFIPVKADLSDLVEKVEWCMRHDSECEAVSRNAFEFYEKYLSKNAVLDYMERLVSELSPFQTRRVRVPHAALRTDPLIVQSSIERTMLTKLTIDGIAYRATGEFPQNTGRNYGVLKGLEKFVERSVRPNTQLSSTAVEDGVVFESRTTRVESYLIGSKRIVRKHAFESFKELEIVHAAFVGKFAINEMLKICPNFVYTVAFREEPGIHQRRGELFKSLRCTVIEEYLDGPTLQKFLTTCTIKQVFEIMFSLQCALTVAQSRCGFVHRDLTPCNVIVQILDRPIDIEYYIRTNDDTGERIAYKIRTKHIPVILDYGKSCVVVENVRYAMLQSCEDSDTDLTTLVVTTLNELMRRDIVEPTDLTDLIHLANFFSFEKILNLTDLKRFVCKAEKILTMGVTTEMSKLHRSVFHLKTSNDSEYLVESFSKYMRPLISKHKISYGKVTLTLDAWVSNSRQIADMGFGLDVKSKVESYLEITRRMYKNQMPQADNRFTLFVIAQKMYEGLNYPKMEFLEFAVAVDLDKRIIDKVVTDFEKMENFIVEFYSKKLYEKKNTPFEGVVADEHLKSIVNFTMVPSRSLFLGWSAELQTQLVRETARLPNPLPPYGRYRSMITDAFRNQGPFRIADKDVVFYTDNFKHILNAKFMRQVWAIETIRNYATSVSRAEDSSTVVDPIDSP